MAKKTTSPSHQPRVQIVCLASSSPGRAARRKTIRTPRGDYQIAIPPEVPFLLVGDDEINAFADDIEAGHMASLQASPEQLKFAAGDALNAAASHEIKRLQKECELLRKQLKEHTEKTLGVVQ